LEDYQIAPAESIALIRFSIIEVLILIEVIVDFNEDGRIKVVPRVGLHIHGREMKMQQVREGY
jgi:hypothetical protein